MKLIGSIFLAVSVLSQISFSQNSAPSKVQKTEQTGSVTVLTNSLTLLNINNFTYWIQDDGIGGSSPSRKDGGGFPRGTGTVLYRDGFIWGGKVFRNPELTLPASRQPVRVGGTQYAAATRRGWVVGTGNSAAPVDTLDPDARVYRIRRDYASMSVDDLRRDAAEVNEIPETEVTQVQMDAVQSQYATDWNNWPVDHGAPYIERNGTPGYQAPPAFTQTFTTDSLIAGNYDEPGIAGSNPNLVASQVTWTVYNDLDTAKTLFTFRSLPIGLELQLTCWAYRRADNLGNTIFKRLKFINKGGVDTSDGTKGSFWLDSMYVAAWSDGDLGSFSDDLAGSDSTLDLGFYWNGNPSDRVYATYNLPPPSFGIGFVEGATVVSPSDSALVGFRRVAGLKNLSASSFLTFGSGMPYGSPPNGYVGSYESIAGQWWKILRGFVPIGTFSDADMLFSSGVFDPSKFVYWGDPLTGTGWIDGQGTAYSFVPGDRREALSSGPFQLAPGDTQEVVVALLGGIGADRLSSVAAMKATTRAAREFSGALFNRPTEPSVGNVVSYPSPGNATVLITARRHGDESGMRADLFRSDSSSYASIVLYDDGLHGDGTSADGLFANSFTGLQDSSSLSLDLTAFYPGGDSVRFVNAGDHLFIGGSMNVLNPVVVDDNGNANGVANPGELIRYGFTLKNNTIVGLPVTTAYPLRSFEPFKQIAPGFLAVGGEFPMAYNPADNSTYFSISIESSTTDTLLTIPVEIVSGYYTWIDTISIPIQPIPVSTHYSVMQHQSGNADGNFGVHIIDELAVKNHTYKIQGVNSVGLDSFGRSMPGYTLTDETLNTILLTNQPFPDSLGFSTPIDGFKITRGTLLDPEKAGMKGWSVPSGEREWTWTGGANGLDFEGFNGAIGWASPQFRFGSGAMEVSASQLVDVLIKFAATDSAGNVLDSNDPNWSYGYRYLRDGTLAPAKPEFAPYIVNTSPGGYTFQAFGKNVPFSAWNVESDPPQRLAVGFLENNVTEGSVDGRYWPPYYGTADNTAGSGPREWFFIFAIPYSETANPDYEVEMIANSLPIMWMGTPARQNDSGFSSNAQFLIEATHILSSNDSWTFNPTITGVEKSSLPLQFSLSYNFPNPFNPATTVEFQVPSFGRVSVKVYDLLGRVVATLVDGERAPGMYKIRWDASAMPSGVYFCRMTAGSFVAIRKMVLIK